MNRRALLAASAAATLWLLAGTAFAHETWLLPATPRLNAPGNLLLSVSSGMDFPRPDTALDTRRVARSGVRLGSAQTPLDALTAVGGNAFFRARLPQAGVAAVYLELPPIPIELSPDLVEAYLEEIQADATTRAAWIAQQASGARFRERYTKFATTFVAAGDATGDHSWSVPLGGPIEIVPQTDPLALTAGASFAVRVLRAGKPLAGLPLALMEAGARRWTRTDADGRASFRLETAGPWLVHGTDLRPPEHPGAEWQSWFATLTLAAERSAPVALPTLPALPTRP